MRLLWEDLKTDERALLHGKLSELYGRGRREQEVFESLAEDKQQALLIFARRFSELGLWDEVEAVLNAYGEGGVGISFNASDHLLHDLRVRNDFTSRFARHRRHAAGFIERGRKRAVVHILLEGGGRRWSAHFDLHSPVAGPGHAVRHLLKEKFGRRTPDWREIREALKI